MPRFNPWSSLGSYHINEIYILYFTYPKLYIIPVMQIYFPPLVVAQSKSKAKGNRRR